MKTIYSCNIKGEELQLCERCITRHCNLLGVPDWNFSRTKVPSDGYICQHCEIRRPKVRKPYREVRVDDPTAPIGTRNRLALRVYPNGLIEVREVGRKTSYSTTVASVYVRCRWNEAMKVIREKKAKRKARRSA